MRFLADMPISLKTVPYLKQKGYDVYYLREKGLQSIFDDKIVQIARKEERSVLTTDLDFGYLMSISREKFPSIILLRLNDERAENVNILLEKYLTEIESHLNEGAIVVFEETRIRIRKLPIE